MKKSDFKTIKKIHFDTCRRIISANGICEGVDCVFECPFSSMNSTYNRRCCDNEYTSEDVLTYESDITLKENCKLFLETFYNDEIKLDSIGRLKFLNRILTIEGRFLKEDICNMFPELDENYIEKILNDMCDFGLIGKTESYYFSL